MGERSALNEKSAARVALPDREAGSAPSVIGPSRVRSSTAAIVDSMDRDLESSTAALDIARQGGAFENAPDDATSEEAARHVDAVLGARSTAAAGLGASAPSGASPDPSRATVGTAATLRHVQRLAGNAAAVALVERAGPLQRDPVEDEEDELQLADVSVIGLTLSADSVTLPTSEAVQATASPDDATGVEYSVAAGSVPADNVAIDESTGAITISAGQRGGTVQVSADGADGSGVTVDLTLIERPSAITATSAGAGVGYGGPFTHTFSAPSGHASGLLGANINEAFDSTSAETPWGTTFNLTANAAGSHGWDLDAAGTMAGPDNVTIGSGSVDIGRALRSTSNPDGAVALPVGFTMTQRLYATEQPGGTRESTAFASVDHVRRLVAGPQFEVTAGMGTITEDYTGPGAVTNATPSAATVTASPPRPESGDWNQRKVTVRADPYPDDTALSYTIRGEDLGCTVDADGEVSIGSRAGTITVRVTAAPHNYDETTITITGYTENTGTTEESAGGSEGGSAGGSTAAPAPPEPTAPTTPG